MATFTIGYVNRITGKSVPAQTVECPNVVSAAGMVADVLAHLNAHGLYSLIECAAIAMMWDNAASTPDDCPCGRPECANVVISAPYNEQADLLLAFVA